MDLFSIALLSLAAGGTTYFLIDTGAGIADLAIKLDYDFRIKVFRLRGLTLKIVLDFILKNPTDKELSISHPLIMLYYRQTKTDGTTEDNFLAQNTVFDKTYKLPAYGSLPITNLDFNISISDLVSVISDNIAPEASTLLKQGKLVQLANVLSNSIEKIRENIIYKAYFKVNGVEIEYNSNLTGLGYSPLSAIDRPIKDGSQFDKYFARPQGKRKIVLKDGEVDDTVRQMQKIVEKDAHLIKEFSQLFKSPSIFETSQKIYDWVYNYLKYNIEQGEQLKNPLVSYELAQRKAREFFRQHGYYNPDYSVDCDDIAIFIGSILKNLNIPFAFRIAAYTPNRGYQHVYVITWDERGNEIIIDPVYWRFNAEKPYVKEKTFETLDGIPVEYLYGTDEPDTGEKLIRTIRGAIATDYFGSLKGKKQLLKMYDYLLQYWNTPQRKKAIQILAKNEAELCRKGIIQEHNFFRLLAGRGLGDFLDVVLASNPFTMPLAFGRSIARYFHKKKENNIPTTPYDTQTPATYIPQTEVAPATDSVLSTPPKKNFWQKAKTPLIIGGAVITIGSLGYLTLQTIKNQSNGNRKPYHK